MLSSVSNSVNQRVVFADLSRAFAVIFMVQGHAMSVLLAPHLRENYSYDVWLYLRGLTAPMFFLLAGFAFTFATNRHWESFLHLSKPFFRRISKFAFLIIVGYGLHLPTKNWGDFRWLDQAAWQSFLQVDVLQCVGITLLGLQLLVLISGTRRRFAMFAGIICVFVVGITPIVWSVDGNAALPLLLSAYLSNQAGSWFSIFPWAAYILFGAILAHVYLSWPLGGINLFIRRGLLLTGLCMVLAGLLLDRLPFSPYASVDFWTTSPNLFLVRSGSVLVLMAAIAFVALRVRTTPAVLRALSEESLLVYFVHICILYGSLWNVGFATMLGPTLGVWPTLAWAAALVIFMTLLALAWNQVKRAPPMLLRWVRVTIAGGVLYFLL